LIELTGVAEDDDFEELLVADLLFSGFGHALAPEVLNLVEGVVVAGGFGGLHGGVGFVK
jgi:hypothetical protein